MKINSIEDNDESQNLSLQGVLQYVRKNATGLLLLAVVFIIILLVERINYINSLVYPLLKPLPNFGGPIEYVKDRKSKKPKTK